MATDPVTVPRPRKVPDSLQQTIQCSLSWRPVQQHSFTNNSPQGLLLEFPSHPHIQPSQHCLRPDTKAGDDFMATGFGPKRQEGRAIPGCEVAGWGLAQTLVGNLHCEESQASRLVWNLPKSGGHVRNCSAPGACPALLKSLYPLAPWSGLR